MRSYSVPTFVAEEAPTISDPMKIANLAPMRKTKNPLVLEAEEVAEAALRVVALQAEEQVERAPRMSTMVLLQLPHPRVVNLSVRRLLIRAK